MKLKRKQTARSLLSSYKKQAGFSLIEMMIASLIGIFITGGAISIHISNKQAFKVQESTSYTQKNARFLINRFNKKISEAGYSGFFPSFIPNPDNPTNPVKDLLDSTATNSILWNIQRPVYGYDNIDTNSLLGISGIVNGSDVLMLKTMVNITTISSQTSTTITLDGSSTFNEADILIATDINNAAIFQISAVDNDVADVTTVTLFSGSSPAPGNTASPVTTAFGTDAEVGKLETRIYLLKPGSNGRNSLFEAILVTSSGASPAVSATEMIPNVENMQFVYGIDTNDDDHIDQYSDATAVGNTNMWDNVRSIGVALLITSDNNNITSEENAYYFDSSTFSFTHSASGDKRYRKPYITYVTLKNI